MGIASCIEVLSPRRVQSEQKQCVLNIHLVGKREGKEAIMQGCSGFSVSCANSMFSFILGSPERPAC